MKRKILWGIVASIISLSLAACSDDNDDAMDYYVRYTVGATAGDDFFISYNDKKGEPHIDQQKNAAGTVEIVIYATKHTHLLHHHRRRALTVLHGRQRSPHIG